MAQPNNVVAIADGVPADLFHQLLDLAIKGRGKLPGVKTASGKLLSRHKDAEAAISRLITEHVALASGQGFATNWGGFFVAFATIPANITASTFVQARMVAGIAHLRGYELEDPRVRTAIAMIMLGPGAATTLIHRGVLPSSPFVVATAPMFDAELDRQVCRSLVERIMNQLSGKRLGVFLGKRIPFVGGGVGAAVDGWNTHSISRHALAELPSRRRRGTSGTSEQA